MLIIYISTRFVKQKLKGNSWAVLILLTVCWKWCGGYKNEKFRNKKMKKIFFFCILKWYRRKYDLKNVRLTEKSTVIVSHAYRALILHSFSWIFSIRTQKIVLCENWWLLLNVHTRWTVISFVLSFIPIRNNQQIENVKIKNYRIVRSL